MSGALLGLACLLASAGLIWLLDRWIGGGAAKFTDLTRPGRYVEQASRPNAPRAVRNDLSLEAYARRRDALGHGAVRPVRAKAEPAQLHGWEDDGGARA